MSAPEETGNIAFPEIDGIPLTQTETVLIYAGLMCFCVICCALIAFGIDAL